MTPPGPAPAKGPPGCQVRLLLDKTPTSNFFTKQQYAFPPVNSIHCRTRVMMQRALMRLSRMLYHWCAYLIGVKVQARATTTSPKNADQLCQPPHKCAFYTEPLCVCVKTSQHHARFYYMQSTVCRGSFIYRATSGQNTPPRLLAQVGNTTNEHRAQVSTTRPSHCALYLKPLWA